MKRDGLMIRRVSELAECGHSPEEIAEAIGMSERAVKNTMALYQIKVRKPLVLRVPAPPIDKLMGGKG